MRILTTATVLLFTATAGCMTGGDELTEPDPVGDEAEVLDEEVAEEPGTDTIAARTGVLPFGQYFSSSSAERAITMLHLVPAEGDLRWFVRKSNHTGRGSGQWTLARNMTTGVRYVKFWRFDDHGERFAIDRYAYKVTYKSPTAVDIKFTHEATTTQFTMSGTVE